MSAPRTQTDSLYELAELWSSRAKALKGENRPPEYELWAHTTSDCLITCANEMRALLQAWETGANFGPQVVQQNSECP